MPERHRVTIDQEKAAPGPRRFEQPENLSPPATATRPLLREVWAATPSPRVYVDRR